MHEELKKVVKYEVLVKFLKDCLEEDYVSSSDVKKILKALGEEKEEKENE